MWEGDSRALGLNGGLSEEARTGAGGSAGMRLRRADWMGGQ
jgi:hypothetical protein